MRLIASLAVVVGLMLLLARLVGKRYGARAGAPVQVLHRQQLSRSASVAVITVGSRVLVVGSTDHQVSLLTELDPEELADAELDGAVDLDLTQAVPLEPATPDLDTTAAPTRARIASLASLSSLSALASLAQRGAQRGAHRGAAPREEAAAIVQPVPPVETVEVVQVVEAVRPARRPATATRAPSTDAGALAGSVLSPQTWRQAFAAATGKAS